MPNRKARVTGRRQEIQSEVQLPCLVQGIKEEFGPGPQDMDDKNPIKIGKNMKKKVEESAKHGEVEMVKPEFQGGKSVACGSKDAGQKLEPRENKKGKIKAQMKNGEVEIDKQDKFEATKDVACGSKDAGQKLQPGENKKGKSKELVQQGEVEINKPKFDPAKPVASGSKDAGQKLQAGKNKKGKIQAQVKQGEVEINKSKFDAAKTVACGSKDAGQKLQPGENESGKIKKVKEGEVDRVVNPVKSETQKVVVNQANDNEQDMGASCSKISVEDKAEEMIRKLVAQYKRDFYSWKNRRTSIPVDVNGDLGQPPNKEVLNMVVKKLDAMYGLRLRLSRPKGNRPRRHQSYVLKSKFSNYLYTTDFSISDSEDEC